MGILTEPEPVKNINRYCRNVGAILIALGFIHLIFSNYLSGAWGIILIAIGLISLFHRSKSMIIVFGIALILVGVLNLSLLFIEVNIFWIILGLLQISWGIIEIRRYKKTKENPIYIKRKKKKKRGRRKSLSLFNS